MCQVRIPQDTSSSKKWLYPLKNRFLEFSRKILFSPTGLVPQAKQGARVVTTSSEARLSPTFCDTSLLMYFVHQFFFFFGKEYIIRIVLHDTSSFAKFLRTSLHRVAVTFLTTQNVIQYYQICLLLDLMSPHACARMSPPYPIDLHLFSARNRS